MSTAQAAKPTILIAEDMFCTDCDEYVQVRATAQLVDEDEGTTELEREDDAELTCSVCGNDQLFDSLEDAIAAARDRYESDRADAIRKGEW